MYSNGAEAGEEITVALHPSPLASHKPTVTVNTTASDVLVNSYVHQLDRNKGVLSTYQVPQIE